MEKISQPKAKALVKKGARLVDLRSPVEYRDYSIPGSTNMSLRSITGVRSSPVKTPIILIGDDATTNAAYNYIHGFGFMSIYRLEDISNWNK